MLLQRVHREIKCKDESERESEAMLVFKHSIKYLKDHLLREIASKTNGIDINDINFVLTVPATWDCTAEMFMREAAIKVILFLKKEVFGTFRNCLVDRLYVFFIFLNKAGIPARQIEIALEPEAASIYCQLMHLDDIQRGNQANEWNRKTGVKYIVIDLGGMYIHSSTSYPSLNKERQRIIQI